MTIQSSIFGKSPSSGSPAPERQQTTVQLDSNCKYTGGECSVCGAMQFSTPSGITCHNGHGGAPEAGDTVIEQAPTAMQKAAIIKKDMVATTVSRQEMAKEQFLEELKKMQNVASWGALPLYMRVRMLMETPLKTRKDEPDRFLTGTQALGIVLEIDDLNKGAEDRPDLQVSPRSGDMWIDAETLKLNITVEGNRKLSGRRNDLGIPVLVAKSRPWPKTTPPEVKAAVPRHFTDDFGVECSISVGKGVVIREAWLSGGWFRNTNNWKTQTEHMLGVRAEGLCYEAIIGKGRSQAHGNDEVEPPAPILPTIEVTSYKEKEK